MIWTNSVEALQFLLKVGKNFLQHYCFYHGFITVISIFNTANSLKNVYTAITLHKEWHTDWATAKNEKLVPHYICNNHWKISFFFSFFLGGWGWGEVGRSGGGSVLLLFNASFWTISTPCSISRQFISIYFKSTELDRGHLSASVIKTNITITTLPRQQNPQ